MKEKGSFIGGKISWIIKKICTFDLCKFKMNSCTEHNLS